MAQLKRSKNDDHLYILAGQSQGTRQIDEEGVKWLQSKGYRIPERGESEPIETGAYLYLRDKGHLDTLHIPYDRRGFPEQYESSVGSITSGLPLFIKLLDSENPSWELSVELSVLADDERAWSELQYNQAPFVRMNYSPRSLPLRLLYNTSCPLKVWPQALPYIVQWEDNQQIRHKLEEAPLTTGLINGWQGNVFCESTQRVRLWQRRLPNSAMSFSGTILWLAKINLEPEWPGNAYLFGQPHMDWQLWRLVTDDKAPIPMEEVQRWLRYRSINLVQQYQRLEIVSPPRAITEDGCHNTTPGKPVLIRSNPTGTHIKGLSRQIYLSAMAVNRSVTRLKIDPSRQTNSAPIPSDQVSYLSWIAPTEGEYRIRVVGDTTSEPLLIRVTSSSVPKPLWLHGLNCTVASSQKQHVLQGFKEVLSAGSNDENDEIEIHNLFAPNELPTLIWTYRPEGLPLLVTWESEWQGDRHGESVIRDGGALTALWQEKIWPAISNTAQAGITLDGASFGCIKLLFIPTPFKDEKPAWLDDARLLTQFSWLSQIIVANHEQAKAVVPASLRNDIGQLRAQVDANSSLSIALDRLARIPDAPTWIIARLQVLIAQAQKYQG